MDEVSQDFKARVFVVVASIPKGKVSTYGRIAGMAGNPRAARIVGGIAHFGDPDLPWQRVVMKDGGLAAGYPGGVAGHRDHLEAEGIEFINGHVNMAKHLWQTDQTSQI